MPDDVPCPPESCDETARTGSPLYCDAHAGDWHYDATDDVTWRTGRHLPGEASGG